MRIAIYINLLLAISCSSPQQVDTDPHNPNFGITIKGLEKSGWEIATADDGVCVYKKDDSNPKLVFYMDMQDDCKKVLSQELYIDLKYWETTKQDRNKATFEITEKLNNEIDSVLLTYNSRRTSDFIQRTPCAYEFKSENNKGKSVDWDIMNCFDKVTLTAYKELN